MNRLQLAQHGYETIAPAVAAALDEETSDRAERWLRDDVCPVFAELARSRSFRLAVLWSCEHLTAGADSHERRLIEKADRALVECAKLLICATLAEAADESGGQLDAGGRIAIRGSDRTALQLVAERPWLDLALAADFFHPFCELGLRNPDHAHTIAFREQGELRVPLGDYVSRCMLARVDYWKLLLDRIWDHVFHFRSEPATCPNHLRNRLFETRMTLDQSVQQLRAACSAGPEVQQREACVTLTQVYAAYAPSPDLGWLGFSHTVESGRAAIIRSCVRRPGFMQVGQRNGAGMIEIVDCKRASLCDPEVLRRIAASLGDVVSLYRLPEDPDERIEWAVSRARFVLVDRAPRAVWWDGKSVASEEWDSNPIEWNLLWTLALNLGSAVDSMMLMNPTKHSIKSRRHRLAKMLDGVLDLDGFIESKRGLGYVLNLPSDDIILLRDSGSGQLVFEKAGGTTV
jgi:hypothetical protein